MNLDDLSSTTSAAVVAADPCPDRAVEAGGSSASAAGPPARRRAWKRTKFRMLQRKAAETGAVLDGAERERLLKHHGLRLKLSKHQLAELLERGAVKLLAGDPGECITLPDATHRADVYRAAAVRLDEGSSLDDVLRVRRIHMLTKPGGRERPPAQAIAAAERHMPADPSVHYYTRLLCGQDMAQVIVAERKDRVGGSHRYVKSAAGADLAALLDRAPPELRGYLEERGFGRVREVPPKCAAQLLACASPLLFGLGLLRLELILRQPASRHAYHQMLCVKQIATCSDEDDLSTLDGLDRFATEYCLKRKRYPNDPESRRINVGKFLLESHILINREIRAAEPADAAMLSGYLLPLPRMPGEFGRALSKASRKQITDGRQVRKDRVEPLAERLPEARFLAGSRTAELSHDQRCCAGAIAEAAKLDTSGPIEVGFSYFAPIYDDDGRRVPGLQRRHWRLMNSNRVHELLVAHSGDRQDARLLPGGSKYEEAFDTEWWLFYERTEGVDGTRPHDPWLSEAVEALALYTGRGLPPELVKRQLAFSRKNGLSSNIAGRLPAGFAWYSGRQANRARRVVLELGLRPFPIAELCHGMLVAHAGTCVMTTSGARTHEFMQIAQDPACLYRLDLLPGGEQRYVFLAIPKGLDTAVPFVITQETVKAIRAWR